MLSISTTLNTGFVEVSPSRPTKIINPNLKTIGIFCFYGLLYRSDRNNYSILNVITGRLA